MERNTPEHEVRAEQPFLCVLDEHLEAMLPPCPPVARPELAVAGHAAPSSDHSV